MKKILLFLAVVSFLISSCSFFGSATDEKIDESAYRAMQNFCENTPYIYVNNKPLYRTEGQCAVAVDNAKRQDLLHNPRRIENLSISPQG